MTDSNWPAEQERSQNPISSENETDPTGASRYIEGETSQPYVADAAFALDDTDPRVATSDQSEETVAFSDTDPVPGTHDASAGDEPGVAEKAHAVAASAGEAAVQLKDTATQKASDVADVAAQRVGEVADVAKDELAKLAGEARDQVQDLWAQASVQLREHVETSRAQLAELLGSLADELSQMASASTQAGPLTTLATQAARRGTDLSRWLADSDPADLVNDIRRFARRQPVVFFGGALLAGVLAGRLGRGLMAASQNSETTPDLHGKNAPAHGSVADTSAPTPLPVSWEEVPHFDADGPTAPAGHGSEWPSAPRYDQSDDQR